MNPLTFLPWRQVALGPVPVPGDAAPELAGRLGEGPVVVTFLRHVGCPFAEVTFLAIRQQAEQTAGVRFVAVTHAPEQATSAWCDAVAGGAGLVDVVVDEQRALYGGWGLGRGSLSHFMGARSLGAVVELSRRGVRNRHPAGTRWQTAGTFAVDGGGVVRFAHVPAHAGDLPDLEAAAASVTGSG